MAPVRPPTRGTDGPDDDNDNDDDDAPQDDDDSDSADGDADASDSDDTDTSDPTTDSDESSSGGEPSGIPILGDGTHDISTLDLAEIGNSGDQLSTPTDCEFHNVNSDELWVTNMGTNSITIFEGTGTASQTSTWRNDGFSSDHFLARPSALAFGQPGVMATSQNTDLITQPSTPWDFMGPTMWGADLSYFNGGHSSHLDMLHNSPNSGGIAWESANIYWVHDGEHGSLTRYDFHSDHGLGGSDHSDGEVYRYAPAEVGYGGDVVSHVAFDPATGYVYLADTANNGIFVLDSNTGNVGGDIGPNYDGGIQRGVNGASFSMMIQGAELTTPMARPSGLEIHDDYLFVTDNETSTIFGFTLEGELVDWLDTGFAPGALMGICFDTTGSMYGVDAGANGVWRISVRE